MSLENICHNCGGLVTPWRSRKSIGRCLSCGLAQQTPMPTPEMLKSLYTESYYDSWGDNQVHWQLKQALYQGIISQSRLKGTPHRVLDVGCATGACLSVIVAMGAEAVGIDINPYAVEQARRNAPQAQVLQCGLMEAEFVEGAFDLIIFSDVLEHTANPADWLHTVAKILTPGGSLLIITPNIESISARIMGHNWIHIKDEHLFYFSHHSLGQLLEKCGLVVRRQTCAFKPINLHYAFRQLATYPVPILTPLARLFRKVIPDSLGQTIFRIPMGEMLVIAVKPE